MQLPLILHRWFGSSKVFLGVRSGALHSDSGARGIPDKKHHLSREVRWESKLFQNGQKEEGDDTIGGQLAEPRGRVVVAVCRAVIEPSSNIPNQASVAVMTHGGRTLARASWSLAFAPNSGLITRCSFVTAAIPNCG